MKESINSHIHEIFTSMNSFKLSADSSWEKTREAFRLKGQMTFGSHRRERQEKLKERLELMRTIEKLNDSSYVRAFNTVKDLYVGLNSADPVVKTKAQSRLSLLEEAYHILQNDQRNEPQIKRLADIKASLQEPLDASLQSTQNSTEAALENTSPEGQPATVAAAPTAALQFSSQQAPSLQELAQSKLANQVNTSLSANPSSAIKRPLLSRL